MQRTPAARPQTLALACLTLLFSDCASRRLAAGRARRQCSLVAKHLSDPDLVLLHVGDKAEYEAGTFPVRGWPR